MSHRIVFIGLWALALVACGSTPEPSPTPASCGPSSCGGCCTAGGRCERGVEVSACGVGGQACVDCGAQGACGQDGRCKGVTPPDGGTPPDAGEPPLGCGALSLPLVNGRAQVSGTTVGAAQQSVGSCGGVEGNEVVYAFTLPSTPRSDTPVVITVTPRDAAFQPVVYLRQGLCDSPRSELSQACVAAHQPGATLQLQTTSGAGSGTFFLVVDGLTPTGGAFDLSVEVGGHASDNCTDVLPLTGRQFTVRGTFSGADDAFKLSCYSSSSVDRVYRLETSEPGYLHVRTEASDSYAPAVAVSDLCGGADLSCGAGAGPGTDLGQLAPGTHYLWLERISSYTPSYLFRADFIAAPSGDACPQARPLVFSNGAQGGTATDAVEAAVLHDDWHKPCAGSDALDVVYTFTTDRTLKFHASATDSVGFTLSLTLTGAPCASGASVACGGTPLDVAELPAGTYYLWVDGFYRSAGTLKLTATLE